VLGEGLDFCRVLARPSASSSDPSDLVASAQMEGHGLRWRPDRVREGAIPAAETSGRLGELEALRGLAAVSLLGYHVWFVGTRPLGLLDGLFSHLWLGVSVFFALSGFLLYRPFVASSLGGRPAPQLSRYAVARCLRILPAYWLALSAAILILSPAFAFAPALLLTVAASLVARQHRERSRATSLAGLSAIVIGGAVTVSLFALSISNALESARQFLFLHTAQSIANWVIGPAWTLGVEVSFYIALPLIAWAVAKIARGSLGGHLATLSMLAALGIAWRLLAATAVPALPALLPRYLDQFVFGMLAATLCEWTRKKKSPLHRSPFLLTAALAAVIATIVPDKLGSAASNSAESPFLASLVALASACLLAHLVLEPSGALARSLRNRPLLFLGRVSYGIFLWHILWVTVLLGLPGTRTMSATEYALALTIVLAATVTSATISWQLIERPALAWKNNARLPVWARTPATTVANPHALAFDPIPGLGNAEPL
jgi:peptidoglycan/LPS O-acetylase OafA/YrhL